MTEYRCEQEKLIVRYDDGKRLHIEYKDGGWIIVEVTNEDTDYSGFVDVRGYRLRNGHGSN